MENTNYKLLDLNNLENLAEFNKLCYEYLGYQYFNYFEYYKENGLFGDWFKSDKGIWCKPETLLTYNEVAELQKKGKIVLDEIKIVFEDAKIDKIYPQKFSLIHNSVFGDFHSNWFRIIEITNEILSCPRLYNTSVLENMKLTTPKEEIIKEIYYLLKEAKNEKI